MITNNTLVVISLIIALANAAPSYASVKPDCDTPSNGGNFGIAAMQANDNAYNYNKMARPMNWQQIKPDCANSADGGCANSVDGGCNQSPAAQHAQAVGGHAITTVEEEEYSEMTHHHRGAHGGKFHHKYHGDESFNAVNQPTPKPCEQGTGNIVGDDSYHADGLAYGSTPFQTQFSQEDASFDAIDFTATPAGPVSPFGDADNNCGGFPCRKTSAGSESNSMIAGQAQATGFGADTTFGGFRTETEELEWIRKELVRVSKAVSGGCGCDSCKSATGAAAGEQKEADFVDDHIVGQKRPTYGAKKIIRNVGDETIQQQEVNRVPPPSGNVVPPLSGDGNQQTPPAPTPVNPSCQGDGCNTGSNVNQQTPPAPTPVNPSCQGDGCNTGSNGQVDNTDRFPAGACKGDGCKTGSNGQDAGNNVQEEKAGRFPAGACKGDECRTGNNGQYQTVEEESFDQTTVNKRPTNSANRHMIVEDESSEETTITGHGIPNAGQDASHAVAVEGETPCENTVAGQDASHAVAVQGEAPCDDTVAGQYVPNSVEHEPPVAPAAAGQDASNAVAAQGAGNAAPNTPTYGKQGYSSTNAVASNAQAAAVDATADANAPKCEGADCEPCSPVEEQAESDGSLAEDATAASGQQTPQQNDNANNQSGY